MKQTAVEWLIDRIAEVSVMEKGRYSIPYKSGTVDITELVEQAKHMEKKQIMDAYSNNGWNDRDDRADAEQYYKETCRSNETREEALQFLTDQAQEMGLYNTPAQTEMKLSAVKYLSDAILSKRYNIDVFELHDAIQNAYLIEKELINKEISDEEIEKYASDFYDNNGSESIFILGAKWYREKLKQRQ